MPKKLDAKGVRSAMKYGMTREAIIEKYGLKNIEDEIRKIYPHDYEAILSQIDKKADKRKSAKKRKESDAINDRMKEADEEMSKVKTEPELLKEQQTNLESLIEKTKQELEQQKAILESAEKNQNETEKEIAKIRTELESMCKQYALIAETIEKLHNDISATEAKLSGAEAKYEDVKARITALTKIIIEVNATNQITSGAKLNFTGYNTKLIELATREELMSISFGEVTMLAKLITAIESLGGKEKVDVKFESKRLAEIYANI